MYHMVRFAGLLSLLVNTFISAQWWIIRASLFSHMPNAYLQTFLRKMSSLGCGLLFRIYISADDEYFIIPASWRDKQLLFRISYTNFERCRRDARFVFFKMLALVPMTDGNHPKLFLTFDKWQWRSWAPWLLSHQEACCSILKCAKFRWDSGSVKCEV